MVRVTIGYFILMKNMLSKSSFSKELFLINEIWTYVCTYFYSVPRVPYASTGRCEPDRNRCWSAVEFALILVKHSYLAHRDRRLIDRAHFGRPLDRSSRSTSSPDRRRQRRAGRTRRPATELYEPDRWSRPNCPATVILDCRSNERCLSLGVMLHYLVWREKKLVSLGRCIQKFGLFGKIVQSLESKGRMIHLSEHSLSTIIIRTGLLLLSTRSSLT